MTAPTWLPVVGYEGLYEVSDQGHVRNNSVANLRYATCVENSADRLIHGTHGRGERCPNHILTEVQVLEIAQRIDAGESCVAISTDYGVSFAAIYHIARGTSWSWLTQRGAA